MADTIDASGLAAGALTAATKIADLNNGFGLPIRSSDNDAMIQVTRTGAGGAPVESAVDNGERSYDMKVIHPDGTIAYFDGRTGKTSSLNNHRYWAGMAVAASAIVSGNCDHYVWGVGALDVAAAQITPDGYLPLELDRGKRARDYHLYAMGPLMMLAYMEHAQGRDALAAHDGALALFSRLEDNFAEEI